MRRSAAVRRDLAKVLRDVRPRHTYRRRSAEVVRRPGAAGVGRVRQDLPARHARQLVRDLRHAELVTLPATGAFVPEDSPERLAELIAGFFSPQPDSELA